MENSFELETVLVSPFVEMQEETENNKILDHSVNSDSESSSTEAPAKSRGRLQRDKSEDSRVTERDSGFDSPKLEVRWLIGVRGTCDNQIHFEAVKISEAACLCETMSFLVCMCVSSK